MFVDRMRAGIAVPLAMVLPYALYLFYGLDAAKGAHSSLAALYISLGGLAFVSGSVIGRVNATLVVWIGRSEWLRDEPEMLRSAGAAVCVFFAACAGIVVGRLYALAVPALLVPALVSLTWLANRAHASLR